MKPIKPIKRADGTIHVPGSKSFTQRALIAASLAGGRCSVIKGALISEDTEYLMAALTAVGAAVQRTGFEIAVTGTGGNPTAPVEPIYMGNNGTGLRLLTGAVSVGQGAFVIDGDERMRQRPIRPLVDALRQLGVEASCVKANGCPPVKVLANGLPGGQVTLAAGLSSQYLSSLLLAAPCAGKDVRIRVFGLVPSWPYVKMTLRVMAHFGVHVIEDTDGSFLIRAPQVYRPTEYVVEGDVSSATYFMAAAAVCGGTVNIANVNPDSCQGDMRFAQILKTFGCTVNDSGNGLTVTGPLSNHQAISFELQDTPDMVPALAVVCAFRKGPTVLKNIGHLRVKESDRIAALTNELRKIGARVEERPDEMAVQGIASRGAAIECYRDHRIAMSFAVAGLALEGVLITDPDCVRKSFPGFWDQLALLG
jgi:3-phosphoshikimate 1-carboxyvinyltransferase